MATTYPTSKQTFTTHVDNSASDLMDAADINTPQDTVAALEDAVGYGTTNGVLPAGLVFPNTYGANFKKAAGTADGSIVEDANDNIVHNIGTGKKHQFNVNGTQVFYIDANGPGKLQVGTRLYLSADQNNPAANGANVLVALDAETYDIGSDGASNVFTAPVDGYYIFSGCLTYTGLVANKVYRARVYQNGTSGTNLVEHFAHSGNDTTYNLSIPFTTVRFLSASDTVGLYAFHNAGANTPDVSGTEYRTYLECILLRNET